MIEHRDLGRLDYRSAWELQKELVERRLRDELADVLLVVEHDPVVTVGRGGSSAAPPLANDTKSFVCDVVEVERGGHATWHGPGQVVVYPIVKLTPEKRDLHAWMRALEQGVIDALAGFGLECQRRSGSTGVWTAGGGRKLCSIGVACSRWVTWHGLALNHEPDLSGFAAIKPCGFDASVMTSMKSELGTRCPTREQTVEALVAALQRCLEPFRAAPVLAR